MSRWHEYTQYQRDKYTQAQKQLKLDREARGLCMRCGKHKPDGQKYCGPCAEKQRQMYKTACERIKNLPPEKKEARKKRRRDRAKEARQRRIAGGLCSRCGKVPPTEGRKMCQACREAVSLAKAKWLQKMEGSKNAEK